MMKPKRTHFFSILICGILLPSISLSNVNSSSDIGKSLENKKNDYSQFLDRNFSKPNDLSELQKYWLCKEIYDNGFIDLANFVCTNINLSDLSTNIQLLVRRLQGLIASQNLEFQESLNHTKSALNLLEKLKSETKESRKLNAFLLMQAELQLELLRMSHFTGQDKKAIDRIDIDLQDTLSDLKSIVKAYSCIQAAYWDVALQLFPDRGHDFVELSKSISIDQDCSDYFLALSYKLAANYGESSDHKVEKAVNKALESMLFQAISKKNLDRAITLHRALFSNYFYTNRQKSLQYLNDLEYYVSLNGSLGAQAKLWWTKASYFSVNLEDEKAVKAFNSACRIAQGKSSLDYKDLLGDFTFLNNDDMGMVSKLYRTTKCSRASD